MATVLQHLRDRHVDLNLHKPVVDEVEGVATFYLSNGNGVISGYQQYRPSAGKEKHNDPKEGRYFTYRAKDKLALFGLESLCYKNKYVFVTEGIFDAVRLTEFGRPALAVLSNDPNSDVINFLGSLNRPVVAVADNNSAGRKLAKCADFIYTCKNTDLGDASCLEVKEIIWTYS